MWIKLKDEGRVSCESELYDNGKQKIDARNLSGKSYRFILK